MLLGHAPRMCVPWGPLVTVGQEAAGQGCWGEPGAGTDPWRRPVGARGLGRGVLRGGAQ